MLSILFKKFKMRWKKNLNGILVLFALLNEQLKPKNHRIKNTKFNFIT